MNIIGNMPTWYYFMPPTNLSCHNLTTVSKPPANWKTLLGLGLNFCIRPRYTNHDLTKCEERMRHNIYYPALYPQNDLDDDFDRKLYINSKRIPQVEGVPHGLPQRITYFFQALKKLFKKKYYTISFNIMLR